MADYWERQWFDFASKIYNVEVSMGLRVGEPHGVQGEPATGLGEPASNGAGLLSNPMKQGSPRIKREREVYTDDDLT